MRTLFVITNLEKGGAEKQFIGIVNFLRDQEDIYVITLFKSSEKSELVVDFSLNMSRFLPSPVKIIQFILHIWKLNPKIIVSFNFPSLLIVKLSRITSHRFIHIISERNEYLGGNFKKLVRRFFVPKNTVYNTNSLTTASNLKKFKITSHESVSYIPNWIEIPNSVRKYKNHSHMKWLYVGRLIKQKNVFFILNLFKEMVVQIPDIELWIVGSGNLERKIYAYILRNGLEKNIFLLGMRNNLTPIYNEFNYLILASHHEGSANVLIEGIAHGLIPISSKVGSYDQLFLNQQFLVIEDFNIEKFSTKMFHLMALSKEDFMTLQIQLLDNIMSFNQINSVGNKWIELIEKVKTKNQV
jgi:glycosyltransferase involved in cell wall biosynthesis